MTDDPAFYRGWFEVHIRPFSAWEENIPEEPQPQKSKERRHFGFVVFISSHCHSCKSITFTIFCFSYQALPVVPVFFPADCDVVRLCRAQIEVIHDYQESRSCVSYSLEGEDSPDLLKR